MHAHAPACYKATRSLQAPINIRFRRLHLEPSGQPRRGLRLQSLRGWCALAAGRASATGYFALRQDMLRATERQREIALSLTFQIASIICSPRMLKTSLLDALPKHPNLCPKIRGFPRTPPWHFAAARFSGGTEGLPSSASPRVNTLCSTKNSKHEFSSHSKTGTSIVSRGRAGGAKSSDYVLLFFTFHIFQSDLHIAVMPCMSDVPNPHKTSASTGGSDLCIMGKS